MRITKKDLTVAVERLAHALGREVGWKKGQLYIDSAYGGHSLFFVSTDGGGGERVPGYVSTRELYEHIMFALKVMELNAWAPPQEGKGEMNFTRKYMIGRLLIGKRKYPIYVKIEYLNDRLSFTGVVGPRKTGSAAGSCGQIINGYKEYDPRGEKSIYDIEPAKGWNHDMLRTLFDYWDRWHLNDMRAGCEHQRAMGWAKRPIDPGKPTTAYGKHHPDQKQPTWNMLIWVYANEVPGGLLMEPCPICGHKYGSAWLLECVPSEVISALQSLPESPIEPAWI